MARAKSEDYTGHKSWKDDISSENFKVLKDYAPHSQTWRSNAIKLEDARFGRQYSRGETEQLLAFRQAPLPISVSSAISDTADAMQVSSKPTVDVSPIIHPYDDQYSEHSKNVAGVFKHLIQKDWYDSLGGLQYDKAISDRTNTGRGLLYAAPKLEYGEFSVDVKNISWKYYFPDPSSKEYLYEDSDNQLYAMPISLKTGYKFAQSIEPDLTFENFKKYWGDNGGFVHAFPEEDKTFGYRNKNSILFCQRLSIEEEVAYIIVPQKKNFNAGGITYRTTSMMTDILKGQEQEGEIKIHKSRKLFLVEHTSIGSLGYKIVYPIDKYNIVPVHYDHRGTPYSYGLMWQLYPLQRALNKFVMSSMLNMALLNTTKVLAEEDSIVNEDQWIQSASMPNAILKYKLAVPGMSTPPEIVPPTPMDAAFLQMPQFLIKMMEYVSGIYGIMQGSTEDAPNVFSTVASLQSAGGIKIKRRQAHADASVSRLASVIGDFYKEYAPMNGFSYNEDIKTGKTDIVKYNQLEVDKGAKGKFKVKVNPDNDLRTGFRKVRFTSTGSMGYESATEAAMLTTLATQLKLPGLVPAILDRMNISGLSDIRDNLDQNKQLTLNNDNLTKLVQDLESKNKSREGQIFQLVKQLVGANAKGQMNVELEKFKSNPMEYLEKSMNMQGED